jgi:hypothetical protein
MFGSLIQALWTEASASSTISSINSNWRGVCYYRGKIAIRLESICRVGGTKLVDPAFTTISRNKAALNNYRTNHQTINQWRFNPRNWIKPDIHNWSLDRNTSPGTRCPKSNQGSSEQRDKRAKEELTCEMKPERRVAPVLYMLPQARVWVQPQIPCFLFFFFLPCRQVQKTAALLPGIRSVPCKWTDPHLSRIYNERVKREMGAQWAVKAHRKHGWRWWRRTEKHQLETEYSVLIIRGQRRRFADTDYMDFSHARTEQQKSKLST